ncbi:hypothetical protein TNCV_952191 [Trichonephila clavipes]|nr:hypothetical protein TNCV_952191 [Trichonephila clavipes]
MEHVFDILGRRDAARPIPPISVQDSEITFRQEFGEQYFQSMIDNLFIFVQNGREVILQWIPSHCGIHVNEQADKLAKEVSVLHPPCIPMPLRNPKQLLRDNF